MKFAIAALILALSTSAFSQMTRHRTCPHPWEVRYGTDRTCYWDTEEWYPEPAHVITDFLSRKGAISTVHQINHWGVSFEKVADGEGDCGYGVYRVRYSNISHITGQPKARYYRLTLHSGDCGDEYEMLIGLDAVR
jgi:hypothetical protein